MKIKHQANPAHPLHPEQKQVVHPSKEAQVNTGYHQSAVPTLGKTRTTHHAPRFTFHVPAWLLVSGLFLTGFGGAFAPWVWRESVALQLTAPGLAEFVKFLPEIRTGQIQLERLYFLVPLFLGMLALPLLAENKHLTLPVWLRWGLRLAIIPLALAALSPVWTPAILTAPEFRLQTALAAVAVGLSVMAPILKGLPLKTIVVLLIGAGSAAIGLPLWQFSLIQASITEAYGEPVLLGWGWWLTVGGIMLSIIGGIGAAFKK